jgi:hypothetical protein
MPTTIDVLMLILVHLAQLPLDLPMVWNITRKQGFFPHKIGQKVPQMALVQLDQSAILDKLFWTWPFDCVFFMVFLVGFFIFFFTSQQYFDINYIIFNFEIIIHNI